nr:uncharacterized protein LOC124818467 [Hydra vulgaris]
MIDQECLLIKCEEWKKCDPSVKVFLRPNCSGEDGGCRVLICDFHREQAWHRCIVKKINNCSEFKDPIISMLRNIAWAQNEKMADAAIVKLKCSNFWLDNKYHKFKKYITNYWLQIKEKWIWGYRQDRFLVNLNTNNGIERQHESFKYSYLQRHKNSSITGMLTLLIEEFFAD